MRRWTASILACIGAALFGCTTYHVHVVTFPPVEVDLLIDGNKVGRTSGKGEANVVSGSRSIFASPKLEIRDEATPGFVQLRWMGGGVRGGSVIRSFATWTEGAEVTPDMFYEVSFALRRNPLPSFQEEVPFGRIRISVLNTTDAAALVGLRSGTKGLDFVVPPLGTATVGLPDGSYEVFVACSTAPLTVNPGESFAVPRRDARLQIRRTPADECTSQNL